MADSTTFFNRDFFYLTQAAEGVFAAPADYKWEQEDNQQLYDALQAGSGGNDGLVVTGGVSNSMVKVIEGGNGVETPIRVRGNGASTPYVGLGADGVGNGASIDLYLKDGVDGRFLNADTSQDILRVLTTGNIEVQHSSVAARYLKLGWGSIQGNSTSDEVAMYATGTTASGIIFYAPSNARADNAAMRTAGLAISESGYNLADVSAILDLQSTTLGFIPPKMTGVQAEAINGGAPSDGTTIFCTNGNGVTINSIGTWQVQSGLWVKVG